MHQNDYGLVWSGPYICQYRVLCYKNVFVCNLIMNLKKNKLKLMPNNVSIINIEFILKFCD